jgi:hypothetical protein
LIFSSTYGTIKASKEVLMTSALQVAEQRFCQDIGLRTHADGFDGGDCRTCLVGQVGIALGVFALEDTHIHDHGVLAVIGEGGERIRYATGGEMITRITDFYIPDELRYGPDGHHTEVWDRLYMKIDEVYSGVAEPDLRYDLE